MSQEEAISLEAMYKRLKLLEDKEAVREAMTRYGLYFDLGRYDKWYDVWTDDAHFATDGGPQKVIDMKNKEEIKATFGARQGRGTTQHLQVNYIIDVDGDTARATGYQMITDHKGEMPQVNRTGIRTFLFKRVKGEWLLQESISHTMKNQTGCDELVPDEF